MLIPESAPMLIDDISEEEQKNLLDRFANGIVKRRLTVPAILFLEVCKPLNFLGSQILLAADPFVRGIFSSVDSRKFALIIERDSNVERLIQLIEAHAHDEYGTDSP